MPGSTRTWQGGFVLEFDESEETDALRELAADLRQSGGEPESTGVVRRLRPVTSPDESPLKPVS
jgi:hypothetical protein